MLLFITQTTLGIVEDVSFFGRACLVIVLEDLEYVTAIVLIILVVSFLPLSFMKVKSMNWLKMFFFDSKKIMHSCLDWLNLMLQYVSITFLRQKRTNLLQFMHNDELQHSP